MPSPQFTWNLIYTPLHKKVCQKNMSYVSWIYFLPGIVFKRNYVRKPYSLMLSRKSELNKPKGSLN